MYHDKRFQRDKNFPFIAFSHRTVKQATSGGFLMTSKSKFPSICARMLSLDMNVLNSIIQSLQKDGFFKPETEAEKECYSILNDIDMVAGGVQGSITSKKYMRNELYSLLYSEGAPSWYVTFTPNDFVHPLCFYWASSNEQYEPNLLPDKGKRRAMVVDNPVAAARFFNYMVEIFTEHILGVNATHRGAFGDVSWYYVSVEQQGPFLLKKYVNG
ncbi:hypothetical protein CYLTODRAFT_433238 [Cylindrobasidium torrendii FP15055 ss-10]|uniref:Helitron helicase-like domain-containing protein n=1 Tax=Cylindrobasidium torrendii FP15055 ss-10 TaxID=1314674 RepID=A0A0D7AXK7_9AGAR|nr:hypothetical protein CYLTODRAFT_433238 [Cylindrobasidium torrendii FP15055 ss-10]